LTRREAESYSPFVPNRKGEFFLRHLPIRPYFQSFLRASLPWALAFIVFIAGLTACKPAASALDAGFLHPPDSAKPRVYWWWLFNRVNKAAITRDLE
jgi:hypothetical protein